jgi:uncharacterized protein YkwD
MKRVVLIIGTTIAILASFGYGHYLGQGAHLSNVQATQQAQVNKLDADTIFDLVNAERVKNGLKPLIRDARLDVSAATKCQDMLKDGYFSHEDENGEVWNFIRAVIPKYILIGENLSVTDEDQQSVMDGWMSSQTHKDNILNTEYKISGMSICNNPTYTVQGRKNLTLVVQHFAVE